MLFHLLIRMVSEMNKTTSFSLILLSLIGLVSCGGSDSDSESTSFELLSGAWQVLEGDYLGENYTFFDSEGTRTIYIYNEEQGCYTEQTPTYQYTEHVNGNQFRPYRLANGSRKYLTNGYISVSEDGNILSSGGGWDADMQFLVSGLTLSYFTSNICI